MISNSSEENLALGIVIGTGYYTFKGDLIRQILLQEVDEFRFHRDAYRYLILTFALTTVGVIWYFIYISKYYDQPLGKTFIKAFELYTTAVPPILPLCLTLGLQYGFIALRKKKIETLIIGRINQAGRIKIMCFDKTGTLTENNLIYKGFITKKNNHFSHMSEEIALDKISDDHLLMYEIFACGHNLGLLKNHPVGDPLEMKMFEQTSCVLEEFTENNVLKKYIVPKPEHVEILSKLYSHQEK